MTPKQKIEGEAAPTRNPTTVLKGRQMVPSDYRALDQKNKPPKKNCHGKKYTDLKALQLHV